MGGAQSLLMIERAVLYAALKTVLPVWPMIFVTPVTETWYTTLTGINVEHATLILTTAKCVSLMSNVLHVPRAKDQLQT